MTDPQPADEPALQEALVQMILKLVLGIGGGSLLVALDLTPEAATLILSAIVAAVLSATQGWRTRNRVFSPLSVQQKTADPAAMPASSNPVESVAIHAD